MNFRVACTAGVFLLAISSSAFGSGSASAPAGFVRVHLPPDSAVLASLPFTPFHPSIQEIFRGQLVGAGEEALADKIVKWDAAQQTYVSAFKADGLHREDRDGRWFTNDADWEESTLTIEPGEGFWLVNRQPATAQVVFLSGHAVVDDDRTVLLRSGLNLFGYPFSTAIELNDTTLAIHGSQGGLEALEGDVITDAATMARYWLLDDAESPHHRMWLDADHLLANEILLPGRGYWYRRSTPDILPWTELRPYPGADSEHQEDLSILSIESGAGGASVTLGIHVEERAGTMIDVFSRDILPDGTWNSSQGWVLRAQRLQLPPGLSFWTDPAIQDAFGRLYLVRSSPPLAGSDPTPPPFLSGCPEDLAVACWIQVPPPATVTADDSCDGAVTVSFSEDVFSNSTNVVVAEWTFPDGEADEYADGGTSANLGLAALTAVGGVGVVGFAQVGATTRAANAAGWGSGAGTKAWRIQIDTTGMENLMLSSKQRGSDRAPRDFAVQYSLDDQVWVDVVEVPSVANNFTSGVLLAVPLPIETENRSTLYLRWVMTSDIGVDGQAVVGQGNARIDDIVIIGDRIGGQGMEIVRTWTAIDNCGGTNSCQQVITVIGDTTPPELAMPPDVTRQCGDSLDPSAAGESSAVDDCDPSPAVHYVDHNMPDCAGSLLRVWTAIDASGNSATATQTIFVVDSTAPVLFAPSNIVVECGASLDPSATGAASAVDACDPDPLIFFQDSASGQCPVTVTRTWFAVDQCGNTGSVQQVITVLDTIPPTLQCPGDLEIGCEDSLDPDFTGQPVVSDLCDVNPLVQYSDEGISATLSNRTVAAWHFPESDADEFADDGLGINIGSAWLDTMGGTGPVGFTMTGASSLAANATGWNAGANLKAWRIQFSASGVENLRISSKQRSSSRGPRDFLLQYSLDGDLWVDVAGVPALADNWVSGMLIDQPLPAMLDDQLVVHIRWVVASNIAVDGGSVGFQGNSRIDDISIVGDQPDGATVILRTWSAEDACGNIATCQQRILVLKTTPPSIALPPDATVDCVSSMDPSITGTPETHGPCALDLTVSYHDEQQLPPFVTVAGWTFPNNGSTGFADQGLPMNLGVAEIQTSGGVNPPWFGFQGATTRSASASRWHDGHDAKAWVVRLETTGYSNLRLSSKQHGSATAPREFDVQYSVDGQTWVDVFSVPPLTASFFSGVIQDVPLPVAVNDRPEVFLRWVMRSNAAVNGGLVASWGNSRIDDILVSGTPQQTQLSFHRHWTAADEFGNATNATQVITVTHDGLPPQIVCPPDLVVNCGDSLDPADTGEASAADHCDPAPFIAYRDSIWGGPCPGGTIILTRTWTATDHLGNRADCQQTITVLSTDPDTVYVDAATGDNAYDGYAPYPVSGQRGPKADLSDAAALAGPGHTIQINQGTYSDLPLVIEGMNRTLRPVGSVVLIPEP